MICLSSKKAELLPGFFVCVWRYAASAKINSFAHQLPHNNTPRIMFTQVGALVLLAALLHAGWNAMLHGSRDRHLSMTWMCFGMSGAALLALPWLPLPAAAAWPYIVASGLVHVAYNLFLVRAYDTGD